LAWKSSPQGVCRARCTIKVLLNVPQQPSTLFPSSGKQSIARQGQRDLLDSYQNWRIMEKALPPARSNRLQQTRAAAGARTLPPRARIFLDSIWEVDFIRLRYGNTPIRKASAAQRQRLSHHFAHKSTLLRLQPQRGVWWCRVWRSSDPGSFAGRLVSARFPPRRADVQHLSAISKGALE